MTVSVADVEFPQDLLLPGRDGIFCPFADPDDGWKLTDGTRFGTHGRDSTRADLADELLDLVRVGKRALIGVAREGVVIAMRRLLAAISGGSFMGKYVVRLPSKHGDVIGRAGRDCLGYLMNAGLLTEAKPYWSAYRNDELGFDTGSAPKGYRVADELITYLPAEDEQYLIDAPFPRHFWRLSSQSAKVYIQPLYAHYDLGLDIMNAHAALLKRHVIRIEGERCFEAGMGMYRVFNDELLQYGGRMYNYSFQQRPKEIRRTQLTIDGRAVIEPDITAVHPTLLLLRDGEPVPKDVYDIPGWRITPIERRPGESDAEFEKRLKRPRTAVKLALVILINAKTIHGFLGSRDKSFDGYDKAKLLADLRTHRPNLAKHFGTDAGRALQRLDSEIMLGVLEYLTAAGIPSLPIHDSVIVPEGNEEAVRAAFGAGKRRLEKHLGFAANGLTIECNGNTWEL